MSATFLQNRYTVPSRNKQPHPDGDWFVWDKVLQLWMRPRRTRQLAQLAARILNRDDNPTLKN